MAEYISREAAIEAITTAEPVNNGGIKYNRYPPSHDEVLKRINALPAADVRPVVRGEWVNDHNGKYSASGDNFYCSICKDPSLRVFGKPAKTNYCPNCGAEMRISSTKEEAVEAWNRRANDV